MTFDAGDPNVDAAEESDVLPLLILPAALERELAESDESLGTLGRPFDRRAPFLIGLNAALGVAVAYLILRGLADITTALVIIGPHFSLPSVSTRLLSFSRTRESVAGSRWVW